MNKINVFSAKAFNNNSIWTLRNAELATVDDQREGLPVHSYCAGKGLALTAIVTTHHHADQAGNIAEFLRARPCSAMGPENEPGPALTHPVSDDDIARTPELGAEPAMRDAPGHSQPHIAYYGLEPSSCGETEAACDVVSTTDDEERAVNSLLRFREQTVMPSTVHCLGAFIRDSVNGFSAIRRWKTEY